MYSKTWSRKLSLKWRKTSETLYLKNICSKKLFYKMPNTEMYCNWTTEFQRQRKTSSNIEAGKQIREKEGNIWADLTFPQKHVAPENNFHKVQTGRGCDLETLHVGKMFKSTQWVDAPHTRGHTSLEKTPWESFGKRTGVNFLTVRSNQRESNQKRVQTKYTTTLRPSNSIPRNTLTEKRANVQTKTCTWMLEAALFIVAQIWKGPKRASTGEWTNCDTSTQ